MRATCASVRVTPRTACPSLTRSRVRASARHDAPPTISRRATSGVERGAQLVEGHLGQAALAPALVAGLEPLLELLVEHVRVAALGEVALVLADLLGEAELGQLLRAPATAARVRGLEHLVDVVDLVLGLDLGRPGRLPA